MKTSWLNSPFPCFSPLLSPLTFTLVIVITMIIEAQFLKEFLNFVMEFAGMNIGTNLRWKFGIDEIMSIQLWWQCACHISQNPFWFWFNTKDFPPSHTCLFAKVVHAFLCEVISFSKWLLSKLPYLANHNASIHSLDILWSYLQFNQSYHTCWTPLLQMQHFYF